MELLIIVITSIFSANEGRANHREKERDFWYFDYYLGLEQPKMRIF